MNTLRCTGYEMLISLISVLLGENSDGNQAGYIIDGGIFRPHIAKQRRVSRLQNANVPGK